jgi:hypothetical protein
MDQLIAEIAANADVDPAVARKAVAIIIGFLAREGPQDSVQELIDKLPGARELAAEVSGGGSGILGVFNDLTGAGLGLGNIQEVTRAFIAHARAKVGEKEVDEVIAAIPGLGPFV